jgi:hypothetical protein
MLNVVFLLLVRAGIAQRAAVGVYNTAWDSPTPETSPNFFVGGMPLGNGDMAVLAWANASVGGISLYVSKQNALHSDASNYKVALLTVSLSPNPFPLGAAFFNQTLDISTGTVFLHVGGTAAAPAASFAVWVDASSNVAYVDVAGSALFTFSATLTPIRPAGYPAYAAPWRCTTTSSAADVSVDPLPPTAPFPSPATIVVLHENLPSDRPVPLIESILATQGMAGAVGQVPDVFAGRRFGVAVDAVGAAGGCAAFQRASPLALTSTAPAACATLRVTVRSSQGEVDRGAWVAALAAQAASAPPAPPRAAHEAWWRAFWTATWVDIDIPGSAAVAPVLPAEPLLWLRASSLSSLPNGSAVAAWGPLSQANASQCPTLLTGGFGSQLPGIHFAQRRLTHLYNASWSLPPGDATLVSVFKDMGSDGGTANPKSVGCCSGILSFLGSFFGLSTLPSTAAAGADDDGLGASDDPLPNGRGISVLGDFSGSNLVSGPRINAAGRTVVATVVYARGVATLYVDGCEQGSAPLRESGLGAPSVGLFAGTRGADEFQRYFEGLLGEAVLYARALSPEEVRGTTAFFAAAGYALPNTTRCSPASDGFKVSQTYAMSRYMNAAQSRVLEPGGGADVQPIKFNGLAWTSKRPGTTSAGCTSGLGPDCREWGPDNWWQNVRLAYWPMLADGDWEQLDVIFTYYLRMAPFLRARAQALLPGAAAFPGMLWQTETATVFGSFTEVDWVGAGAGACAKPRPADLPPYLQNNPFIYLDAFGDGPTGELGLLALDAWAYSGNETALAARLPWIFGALDYFEYKFFKGGAVRIAPTQACETLWSPWPITNTSERVEGDAPTIAVVTRLLERTLSEVPRELVPAARRQSYAAVLAAMPALPRGGPNNTLLAPAQFANGPTHNSESVALYSVHPTRHFSVGRLVTGGVTSLAPAVATFFSDPNAGGSAKGNNGWHQGTMHAPLLGLRNETGALLVARTAGTPLPGFRLPFFSAEDGMGDEAACEAFSNLASGVQFALLQPGEQGAVVALPGWPCAWDVHFKLRAPQNTTVEGVWRGGQLRNLTVVPASRAPFVYVAKGC